MESSAEFISDSFICHIHFSAVQWWAWERRWDSCGLWTFSVPHTEKRNSGQTRNTNILLLRHKQFYCSDNVQTFSLLQKCKTPYNNRPPQAQIQTTAFLLLTLCINSFGLGFMWTAPVRVWFCQIAGKHVERHSLSSEQESSQAWPCYVWHTNRLGVTKWWPGVKWLSSCLDESQRVQNKHVFFIFIQCTRKKSRAAVA